jgi:hypothetical protein
LFFNYFMSTFCKMLQHFLEMLDNIFLILLSFFQHFSKMLQHFIEILFFNYFCQHLANVGIFFRNVGFVNYSSSTCCKMLKHFFGPTFSKLTLFCLLPNHRRRRRRVGLGARGLGRGSPASSRAGARGLGHGSPASLRVGARGKAAARAWRTRTGGGHSGCSKDARRTAAEGLGRSGRAEKVAA